jgi:hypothetical protein
VTDTEYIPDYLGVVFGMVGISLGISLGIMQCLPMIRWKVPAINWSIATAAGWGIPAYILPRFRVNLLLHGDFIKYLQNLWIIYPAMLIIIGAFIGTLQVLMLGRKMNKPIYWVLANAFGLLVLGLLVKEMLNIPIGIITGPIDQFLVPHMRSGIRALPLYQMWQLIGAITPILATLVIGIPTGIIFELFELVPVENIQEPDAG